VKNKKKALEMLKKKMNGEEKITYEEIGRQTGYSKRQLIRLSVLTEEKDIDSILLHGNTGRKPSITATDSEISYIIEFKKKYPVITIAQFRDIYHEDVIWNKEKKEDIEKHKLKIRSYYFYEMIFRKQGWKSPIKHKRFGMNSESHPLRDPSPRRGMLVIIDGTPHDWFENGKTQSLHNAVDDATGEILGGWFMSGECLEGYSHLLEIIITKHGIPACFYSDRYGVFYNEHDEPTQFGRMCEELGIHMIIANTPEARGKVERKNFTIQNRLLNDIRRYDIKSLEQLNKWYNDFYVDYLNKKFAYEPLEKESEYVPLDDNTNLSSILCRKETRTILNGNCVSYLRNYYQIINEEGNNYPMYKGTEIILLISLLNPGEIKIEYRNKIFNTKKIKNKKTSSQKGLETLIRNKKQMAEVLRMVQEKNKLNKR